MSAVVAIDVERLEAFAGELAAAAEELRAIRAAARRLPCPDLGPLASAARALDDGSVDARRSAAIVRLLPSMERPPHTSVLLGRPVAGPYLAPRLAAELVDLLAAVRAGHAGSGDIGAALDRFLAAADDPLAAAAALGRIGVRGLRALYELVAAEAGDVDALHGAGRTAVEARLEAVTGVVLRASRTVDVPGGLSRRFVDELLPAGGLPPGAASHEAWTVSQVVTAAGAGQYLAEAAATAVGTGRLALVVRAGRVLAFAGLAVGVVEALANGGEGLAESVLTGGLGVIGALAGGPVGFAMGGLSLLLTAVLAIGARPGRPPARTYPTDQRNPGGSHYVHHADGAGVPVAPTG